MSKQPLELVHLTREVKTALELAIAGLAPSDLIDRIAVVAGLLEAFASLALDDTTTLPLVERTIGRAKQALEVWRRWQHDHPPKATA
jgi:hypothetical protein